MLHAVVDFCRDLLGEIVFALVACGLLALGWWGFRVAPYLTASIVAGVLVLAGYGVVAYAREVRGRRLIGRLGGAGVGAAAVVVVVATYLPSCECLW